MLIAQKYEVVRKLGQGSFGVVSEARDLFLDRVVAIKTIRDDRFPSPEAREQFEKRFLREARSAARLSHPNIVSVLEAGRNRGSIYIAMEYVEGRTLREYQQERKRLDADEAVRILVQILRGLHYAHEQNIVHRDVKPANILLREDGTAKLSDFGTAKLLEAETLSLTRDGALMGTPSYMAPEQLLSRDLDGRADIFSAGIVLYEVLSGARPFLGESVGAIVTAIVSKPAPPIEAPIPARLRSAIDKALAKDPKDRFANALEMIDALEGRSHVTAVAESASAAPITSRLDVTLDGQVGSPDTQVFAVLRRAQRVPTTPPEIEGSLERAPAPEVLLQLRAKQWTGLLTIESKSWSVWLDLLQGLPIGASGGPPETLLGRVLIDLDFVGEKTYRRALEQYQRGTEDPNLTMGSYLVRMGIATPDQILKGLERQLDLRLTAVTLLQKGTFRCHGGLNTGEWGEMSPRPVELLVADALRRDEGVRNRSLRRFVRRIGKVPAQVSEGAFQLLSRFRFGAGIQRLLKELPGRGVDEVLRGDRGEPLLAIYLMWCIGAVRFEGIEMDLSLRSREPAALPVRDSEPSSDVETSAEAVDAKLQWAVEAMANRDFVVAVDLLRGALKLDPAHPVAGARLGWAVFRSDPESEANRSEAIQLLSRVLENHPRLVPALLALGKIHRYRGEAIKAEALFLRATQFDPSNREAQRELSQLRARSARSVGGA